MLFKNINSKNFRQNNIVKVLKTIIYGLYQQINLGQKKVNKKITNKNFEPSEQYLIDVSKLIPSVIIGLDHSCNILHLNQAAETFIGGCAADVVGRPIQEIMTGLGTHMELIKLAVEARQFKTLNKIKISINNVEHFLKIVAHPFEKTNVTLYIDDITERVFMENLLVQTEKMTTLGTLAAGMAHEINNALSGVLQSIQNINRRLDPTNQKNIDIAKEHNVSLEQVQKYLDVRGINPFFLGIRELSEHASIVVKNVLKFSRRSDYEMIEIDINSVVQDALSIISTDYDIKKKLKYDTLTIKTELIDKLPKLCCIPSEIEQVLLNLVKNAAQALTEKEFLEDKPTITIYTKSVPNKIRIEVVDNGPGIPDQFRQYMFKPFFTTKPIGVGTGLGLSICHYIVVDKHHGSLELESTVGVGATFIIEIPIALTPKKESPPETTNAG